MRNNTCFLFLLFINFSFAQVINGRVVDKDNRPLSFVTVQLIEKQTEFTKKYTSTDVNGNFSIEIVNSVEEFYLKISLLGYKTDITSLKKNKLIDFVIVLEEQLNLLDEVVIESDYKEFEIRKDSIIYNINSVRDSTETNLKDLLEKLPGLTIDENGKISFQEQRINKIVIEGEDFFGTKHEMATENLPAEAIQGIQILKNFKEFEDIGDQKTGKIVLNVSLDKNYKNKIVGNIEENFGLYKKNQAHLNLFKFLKKGNFAFVSEANNIGDPAINMIDYIEMQGGIANFTNDFNSLNSGIYEIDHSKIPRFVFVNKNVDNRNTIFNSLSFVNKVSNKMKMNGYFTLDFTKVNELKTNVKDFIGLNSVRLNEREDNSAKSYLGNSFINIIYKKNEKEVFKYNLKINPLRNEEQLLINSNNDFKNYITDNDFLVGQYLEYKNQLKPKLYLQSGVIYDYKTQDRNFRLDGNQPFFGLTFVNKYSLEQKTRVKQNTLSLYSKITYSLTKNTKISSKLSHSNNKEQLNNYTESFSVFNFDTNKKSHHSSFFNTINHKFNKFLSVRGSLDYLHSNLEVFNQKRRYNWFLPSFNINLKFDDEKSLTFSYSKLKKIISIYNMNNMDRVVNYQTIVGLNNDFFTPETEYIYNLSFDNFNASRNRMFSFKMNYFLYKNKIGYSSVFGDNFIEQNYIRVPEKGYDVNLYHSKTIKILPLKWNAKVSFKRAYSLSYFREEENNKTSNEYLFDLHFISTFKNTPFQIKLNFNKSKRTLKNDFYNLDYSITQSSIYPQFYGKIDRIKWNLGCLFQNVKSENSENVVYSLNFLTEWNLRNNVQLFFKGDNILNLRSNQFISRQNTESFSQLSIFERLEGYVLLGMRYHF